LDRQEVLQSVLERVRSGGGTLVKSVKDLAEEVGVGPQRLYYLLKSFDQKGELVTRSRGPKGLEISLASLPPDGAPARPTRQPRPRRRRVPAARPTEARADHIFCPWCGGQVQGGWRYCVWCGDQLPAVGVAAGPGGGAISPT
jgi:hypothetical protein